MKINNVRVYGLEESIIASGYPMKTELLTGQDFDNECNFIDYGLEYGVESFNESGVNDFNGHIKRVKTLARAKPASGHDCMLKGIIVQADITAPQYFWLQWERYHFQDTISSQSTMHRITKMDLQSQMNQYVDQRVIDVLQEYVWLYNKQISCDKTKNMAKETFQRIVSNIPEGIELTRRVTLNYLQLKSMYSQRKTHKIEEWREIFCPWILTLPHFEELVLNK